MSRSQGEAHSCISLDPKFPTSLCRQSRAPVAGNSPLGPRNPTCDFRYLNTSNFLSPPLNPSPNRRRDTTDQSVGPLAASITSITSPISWSTRRRPVTDDTKQKWLEANPVVSTLRESCEQTERTRNGPISPIRSVPWALLSSPRLSVVLPTPRVSSSRRSVSRPSSPTLPSESVSEFS